MSARLPGQVRAALARVLSPAQSSALPELPFFPLPRPGAPTFQGEASRSQSEQVFHLAFRLKFRSLASPRQVSALPQPLSTPVPSSLKVPEGWSVLEEVPSPRPALALITGEARDRCTQQFEGCLYQCPLTTCSPASFTQNEWSLLASAIALTNVILPRLPLFQRPLFLPSLSYRVRIIAQDLPSASSRA